MGWEYGTWLYRCSDGFHGHYRRNAILHSCLRLYSTAIPGYAAKMAEDRKFANNENKSVICRAGVDASLVPFICNMEDGDGGTL